MPTRSEDATPRAPLDMSSAEFRRLGHRLVDDLADFYSGLRDRPVAHDRSPSELRALLVQRPLPSEGEDASRLLGSLLLTQFELAAMSRASIPEDEREDFYLYIDEFPIVATDHATGVMAESRKYRLCLIVAMQYVEQLDKELRNAVFENVGTQIAFRCGPGSAQHLAQEFKPEFEDVDFLKLPRYNVILRLVIDGVASLPPDRSAPAQKARPAPVTMIARTSSSASARSKASIISANISPVKALSFSGRLRVSVRIPSSTS